MIMIIIVIDGGSCYNKLVYYKRDIYEAQIFAIYFIDDISDDGLLWRKREHETSGQDSVTVKHDLGETKVRNKPKKLWFLNWDLLMRSLMRVLSLSELRTTANLSLLTRRSGENQRVYFSRFARPAKL
ncbi:hypothetical protein PO124_10140 [Bacillus licheniformis]|nr:hypothetical protein [Bacillus licheniformis]